MSAVKARKLRVFLCHASEDKLAVTKLYEHLAADGVDPWLDSKNLLPGQEWEREIERAVAAADAVVVCVSQASTHKIGYVQKELRYALDAADRQPEGAIYIVPVRLDECAMPDRLRRWHWVDLFKQGGHDRLVAALRLRASALEDVVSVRSDEKDNLQSEVEAAVLRREQAILGALSQMFLPSRAPEVEGLELVAYLRQAAYPGGDFYDFDRTSDGNLAIVVADVAGRGLTAMMTVSKIQAGVKVLHAAGIQSPAEVVSILNNLLVGSISPDKSFVALFYGLYEPKTRRLSYVGAGYMPALLIRAEPGSSSDWEQLPNTGVLLGVFGPRNVPGFGWTNGSAFLRAGDTLAIFSDGFVEATDKDDKEFGESRLRDVLLGGRNLSLSELGEASLQAVSRWSGKIADDQLIVLLRAL
jgi:serine phosphatase RsbU (regulator of sigma subunit)